MQSKRVGGCLDGERLIETGEADERFRGIIGGEMPQLMRNRSGDEIVIGAIEQSARHIQHPIRPGVGAKRIGIQNANRDFWR